MKNPIRTLPFSTKAGETNNTPPSKTSGPRLSEPDCAKLPGFPSEKQNSNNNRATRSCYLFCAGGERSKPQTVSLREANSGKKVQRTGKEPHLFRVGTGSARCQSLTQSPEFPSHTMYSSLCAPRSLALLLLASLRVTCATAAARKRIDASSSSSKTKKQQLKPASGARQNGITGGNLRPQVCQAGSNSETTRQKGREFPPEKKYSAHRAAPP